MPHRRASGVRHLAEPGERSISPGCTDNKLSFVLDNDTSKEYSMNAGFGGHHIVLGLVYSRRSEYRIQNTECRYGMQNAEYICSARYQYRQE